MEGPRYGPGEGDDQPMYMSQILTNQLTLGEGDDLLYLGAVVARVPNSIGHTISGMNYLGAVAEGPGYWLTVPPWGRR